MHTHTHTCTECDTKRCLLTGSSQGATLPSAQVIMMTLYQCQRAGAEAIESIHIQRRTHTCAHTHDKNDLLSFWIYRCLMRVIIYCMLVFISLLLALCCLSFWLFLLSLTPFRNLNLKWENSYRNAGSVNMGALKSSFIAVRRMGVNEREKKEKVIQSLWRRVKRRDIITCYTSSLYHRWQDVCTCRLSESSFIRPRLKMCEGR